jgi:hypothetical protein
MGCKVPNLKAQQKQPSESAVQGDPMSRIASGNPFNPSTQAMKISFTPRFFSSVSTCSQNLAPSCCATHSSQDFLLSGQIHPQHHIDRLVLHVAAVAHLYHHGVDTRFVSGALFNAGLALH